MSNKLIYLISFLLFGCVSIPTDMNNVELAKLFFKSHISIEEQQRYFKTYSMEEQYDIFIYGNQVIHPPAIYLADLFAVQGMAIVPFLNKKLKVAKKEITVRDIALVFEEMVILKLYDFSNEQELMDLLDKRANDMQGIWKRTTLDSISRIRLESIPNSKK